MSVELLNIDCMEFMATQPDNAFDLALVDPPFGRGEHGGIKRSSAVKQKNGAYTFVRDGNYDKKTWDAKPPTPDSLDTTGLSGNYCGFALTWHSRSIQ